MTSKGIAQRLIAKWGQQEAGHRVKTRIEGIRLYWGTGVRSRHEAAQLYAYLMLWSAVLHHVKQS